MPLTDTAIRNAKPGLKPAKLFDERGLFLLVTPAGGKWWRFRFRYDGKEKLLSLGVYPDVGLKEARNRRDDARKLLTEGIAIKPITLEIAALANQFPDDYSGDPADRLIGATARAEGLTLVTRDENIRRSPLIRTVW